MTYTDWRQLVSLGEGDEFCIQSPASGSVPEATVRFPLRLVAWLSEAIQDGATLEPPREAGGVLVGAISQPSATFNGTTPDVSVDLFLPIACSDSGAPLYRPSERDRDELREQLKGVGVSSVVGLYRTNLRPEVELDEADEALAADLLTCPGSIFLIVQPEADDGPQATLFLRGAKSMCREPALTFPFDYVQLKGLGVPRAAVHEAEPAQTASYLDGTSSSMAVVHQEWPAQTATPIRHALLAILPPRQAGRKWALAGGIAALLALAFAAGKIGRRPAAVTPEAPATAVRSGIFNLKAAMEQDHLRITWDPRALPLDAREGALLITDGEAKTQIPMDASVVSQGSVEYYPQSGFLRLELRIASLSDMVMVAGLNAGHAEASPSQGTQSAKNEAPRAKASPPQQPAPFQLAASQLTPTPQSPTSQPGRAPQPPASQLARASQSAASQPAATPQSQPAPIAEAPASQPPPAAKQFQLPRQEPPPPTPVLAAATALPQGGASPSASLPQTAAPRLNPPPPAPAPQSTPSPEPPAPAKQEAQATTPPAQPAPAKPVAQSTTAPAQPAPAKPAGVSTPSLQIAPPATNSPTDFAVAQVKERVLPTVSANLLRLASPAVIVHVKVQIDDQGKVVKAESLTHGAGLVDTLAGAAVEAARHWQFVPARRGNQNVTSETVLNFTFAPGN